MNQRLKRLADQIQRELAELIRLELNDPRLTSFITVSDVKVSPDLGYADVYVTVMDPNLQDDQSAAAHQDSLELLNGAAGFMRGELGKRLKTRVTPRLRFHYDEVTVRGNKMLDLISQAVAKTKADEQKAGSTDDANDIGG